MVVYNLKTHLNSTYNRVTQKKYIVFFWQENFNSKTKRDVKKSGAQKLQSLPKVHGTPTKDESCVVLQILFKISKNCSPKVYIFFVAAKFLLGNLAVAAALLQQYGSSLSCGYS